MQKRIRSVLPQTEQEASLAYNPSRPVVSSVVNERSQNKWGIAQGYRIQVLLKRLCVMASAWSLHKANRIRAQVRVLVYIIRVQDSQPSCGHSRADTGSRRRGSFDSSAVCVSITGDQGIAGRLWSETEEGWRRRLKHVRCAQVDSVISQLYPDSWLSTQAGTWSRYQIATTVRRENETASSSIYAAAHPGRVQPRNLHSILQGSAEQWDRWQNSGTVCIVRYHGHTLPILLLLTPAENKPFACAESTCHL